MRELSHFFNYARARYEIHLRRQAGEPPPWTGDSVLQDYYFCNVFREDDKTTGFVRRNVRDRTDCSARQLFEAIVIARWFNRIETLVYLGDGPRSMLFEWDSDEVRRRLDGVSPIVTGAFVVKTPNGKSKLEGLIWCIENLIDDSVLAQRVTYDALDHIQEGRRHLLSPLHPGTLREVHDWLKLYPYLGGFMAYEIVTDLRHTWMLENATDKGLWAHPGPGATRGANRVIHGRPEGELNWQQLQDAMLQVKFASTLARYWPREWPSWEMREVEHTLCEFDKYRRAQEGGRLKRRYDAGPG